MYGNRYGDTDDATHRHGADPRDITAANRTVPMGARDDSADITVPLPAALPRRTPAHPEAPPGGRAAIAPGPDPSPAPISVRIGKGVVPAGRSRSRDLGAASRRWQGHLTRVLSGLATLVLVAAAAWTGWQWWQRLHNRVEVANVAVAPAPQPAAGCDIQYDIVGTITTNGKAGTISYEWIRSDGQESGTLKQSVAAGQTSTTVHLYWKFTGEGSMTATATLRVLDPTRLDGATQFHYSCP
jgi:hypothetical protein